jgi:hypothetical protein
MTIDGLTSGGPVRHPSVMNAEADALVASLNDVREHVLGVLEELPEDALRAAPVAAERGAADTTVPRRQ